MNTICITDEVCGEPLEISDNKCPSCSNKAFVTNNVAWDDFDEKGIIHLDCNCAKCKEPFTITYQCVLIGVQT